MYISLNNVSITGELFLLVLQFHSPRMFGLGLSTLLQVVVCLGHLLSHDLIEKF